MDPGRTYDEQRLAELIVYVADRLIGDPRFGLTKLYKVLFFTDFTAFRRLGHSITGAAYQRLPQGPCPHQALPVIKGLGRDVVWREKETPTGTQRQLIPLRPARLELFTGPEVAIVDEVIETLRPLSNRQVSALSHETMAWRLTADRDEIPYGSALLSSDVPTDEDLAWLEGVAERAGVESSAG